MGLYREGRRLGSNEIVELGDETRCGHPGCNVVVGHIVPHPDGFAGMLTEEHTAAAGRDMHYRDRCSTHAERPSGQLDLFKESA